PTSSMQSKQRQQEPLVPGVDFRQLAVHLDGWFERAGDRIQFSESVRSLLKQAAEMLADRHPTLITLVDPCVPPRMRPLQQVAGIERWCSLETLDRIRAGIDTHTAHEV